MILVTGGAGFIGSNLVAELSDEGLRPCVCDRLGQGDKWRNIAKHRLGALVEPEGLERFLTERGREIDFVYHMGAISSTTVSDADLMVRTNVRLSQHVWRWCAETGTPLVYASSAATYGDGSQGFSDDADPRSLARLRPLNVYGWSKHVFDRWVIDELEAGRSAPPQWVGLKFFNVYGPNEYHKGTMRSLVTKAYPAAVEGRPVTLFRSHHPDYPDGGQMRDFVSVDDCVRVMSWLRANPRVSGLFNLGSGRAQTWLELMSALYGAVGRELTVDWVDTPEELRDRYQYFTEARMEKLRDAGYEAPFMPVEEGVRRYVERFLATDDPYR